MRLYIQRKGNVTAPPSIVPCASQRLLSPRAGSFSHGCSHMKNTIFFPRLPFFPFYVFGTKPPHSVFFFFSSTFPVISTLLTLRSPARCFVTREQQIMLLFVGGGQLCTTAGLTPSCWLALQHDGHTLSGKWRLCCE